jgi:hypothetical protein
MNDKRKMIQDLIDKVLKAMDISGVNAEKYRKMFQVMSDEQFSQWITKFLADPKSNIRVDIEEFGSESRKLKFENIEKAADILGIKLFEYVYMPHLSADPNRPVRTKEPVLVGYLNIKRPQQMVMKKTGLALSDTNRDEQTGAMKGDSKGGTTTGVENELLAGAGADVILSEISGARGDNVTEYDNMLDEISRTGSVKLEDIKTGVYDKPTLMQTDLFLKAMGVKTDLISESYYSIERLHANMYDLDREANRE